MADWNLPTLSSLYTDFHDTLKARDNDALIWLDGSTSTNLPSGAKRWNNTNSYFEKFNGSTWSPLASKYMINVDLIDGCTVNDAGSTSSDLWTASKITTALGTKLDTTSYTASDVLTKIKTVDGAGSGLDADLLDGQSGSYYNNGDNIVWGVANTAGKFYTGTTTPTGTTRLNYSGYFYPTQLNLVGTADTTAASTHIFVENSSDGFVRPKALADFKSEVFASPTLTGTPTTPTATAGTNTTQVASTEFVNTAISTSSSGTASTYLSGVTAYHLLEGDLSVSNTVLTNGFGVYLYTGNTTTLPTINLGMDITSQWGNVTTEKYGYLIIIKSRSAIGGWSYVDSIRGNTKYIDSSSTAVEGTDANMFTLNTVAGITTVNIGTSTRTNTNGVTYLMEVYQTTHIKTGTTNHTKAYTEHYNMVTGFTINGYAGSGLAGHEVPHSLGRNLGLRVTKNLSGTNNWLVEDVEQDKYLQLNTAIALTAEVGYHNNSTGTTINLGLLNSVNNASGSSYVLYGWANSYIDESGKLIGNFEVGTYQGTGVSVNNVTTKGKLAELMIKRLDSTGDWLSYNNITANKFADFLYNNLTNVEVVNSSTYGFSILADGFSTLGTGSTNNALGGQYLYFGVYDNDSGSGKSKYPRATDTSTLTINNAIIPFAQGIDTRGTKTSTISKNESITTITYTAGKNYVYSLENGTYGVSPYRPRYFKSDLLSEKAGDNPDYFDLLGNTWYSTIANPELVTNGTFSSNTTGWTAVTSTLSVSNGSLVITNVGTNYGSAYQVVNTTIGKKYKLRVSLDAGTSTQSFDFTNGAVTRLYNALSGHNDLVFEFVAEASTVTLSVINANNVAGQISYVQEISMYAIDLVVNIPISSRNYLNHIVYADANGQLTYEEELPKTQYFDKIETGSNRKVMYLDDYGISAIQVNKRYALDNPFGNENFMDCDTKLEIYDNGVNKWIEVGSGTPVSGNGTNFTGAKSFSAFNGIIIQTAITYLASISSNAFIINETPSANLTSAPARVTIQFNGKTGRTR